jgi:hypothetical protein
MKIAEELSSIKNELSSLKQELYQSKHPAVEHEEQNGGGFFDGEEDEKIALTGDELNTILNTADFTAEAGASDQGEAIESEPLDLAEVDTESPETPDLSEQLLEPDVAFFAGLDAAMEDLPEIEDSFIFSAGNMEMAPEIEMPHELEIPPDMEISSDMEIPPDMEISPELEMLRENGVEPMTPVPEDISFLEEDPADTNLPFMDLLEADSLLPPGTFSFENSLDDISSFDDSSFDFEDAVIEEPDLKGELKENPIEEPSLENFSLELDMEPLSGEDETMELPDSGGDRTDANEEIEIHPDDSGGSNELVSDGLSDTFSPNDDLLDTTDISIDDLIDVSPAEEAPENIGDALNDDAYDQVIPEGFLIESGDSPAREQNILDDGLPENIDDSLADPFVMEDILEIEDFAKDGSADLEPIPEEPEPVPEDLELIPEELEPVPEEPEVEEAPAKEEDDIAPVADIPALANASPQRPVQKTHPDVDVSVIPPGIKLELRSVLSYMDQLLESLPENKIEEFAKSEYFDTYKKLFEDLGLA